MLLLALSAFGCRESAETSPEPGGGLEAKKGTAAGDELCPTIAMQWSATLSAAKRCSLDASAPACSRSFDNSIDRCGQTFVDESNRGEINELEAMSKSWASLGCKSATPCAAGAKAPTTAICVATGQQEATGMCTDQP